MEIPSKISNFEFDEGRFVKCSLDVCHDGGNYNGSWFDKDVIERCAYKSLAYTPILANVYYDEDWEEYLVGGHDMDIELIEDENGFDIDVFYLERPVGFVPPDTPIEMVYNPEDGKNHLKAYCVIWKKYSEQLLNIMEECNGELSVSMEIEALDTQVSQETGDVIINDFVFQGITILGTCNPPAMQGAKIKTFSKNNIKIEIEQMIKEYSIEKGGENMEENKKFEDEVVEEVQEQPVEEETVEEVEDEVQETEDVVEEQVEEEQPAEEIQEVVEEETVEEVEDEVQETEEVVEEEQPVEETQEVVEESTDEYSLLQNKYAELEASFNQLKEEYSMLESKLNSMQDYEELKAFKEQYDRAEYESEVEEVAQMFGLKAEEVEELKSKALNKEISVEQFKEKLALKYAMNQLAKKPKVEDSSSEMSIIDEDEVELSNKPYGGYFEKYKNKK